MDFLQEIVFNHSVRAYSYCIHLGTILPEFITILKCLWIEIFAYFFILNYLVYDPLIQNFRVWASEKRVRIFSAASKLANSRQKVRHSTGGQNMQISTFDVIRCVKLLSHCGIREEQEKEGEVFRHRRVWFSELQITTYTEGTVLLIFPKDEVRRADCKRFIRIHRPNCKATNVSVLCTYQCQSGGGEAGHKAGIWHFPKNLL